MNTRQALEIERQRLRERFEEQPGGRVFAPLADCHRKLGQLDEALEICLTGLARHPEYSSAHLILGKIHLERGDTSAARDSFEKVLELDAHNLLALRQLAEIEEQSGRLERAEARWQQVAALEIDPEAAQARLETLRTRLQFVGESTEAPPEPAVAEAVDVSDASDASNANDVPSTSEVRDTELTDETEVTAETAETEDSFEAPASPEANPFVAVERPAKRSTVPTAEIATMTLAEIYSEQGFKSKALEIYRQILVRNPEVTSISERISALELEMARPAPSAPAVAESFAPAREPEEADLDELEASSVPTPHTQLSTSAASVGPRSGANSVANEPDEDEPRAQPSPPLEAPVQAGPKDLEERERYSHFRSWLDRIRVDEN